MSVIEVTEQDFQETIQNTPIPVLVEFVTDWCSACQETKPVVEELARQWNSKVKVFQVDFEKYPELAVQHGILVVPTIVLFKDGKLVEKITGTQPLEKLRSKFQEHLN